MALIHTYLGSSTAVCLNKRNFRVKTLFFLCLAIFTLPAISPASVNEQMAISTRAISMGNAVTAMPPGHMSMHYNPAGLSKIPVGAWWHQGFVFPWISKKGTFRGNEDFVGWLEMERWDHHADPIYKDHYAYGDEGREKYSADELKVSGRMRSGVMFLPILNKTLNFSISPRTSLAYREEGSRLTLASGMYTPFASGGNHSSRSDPHRFGSKKGHSMHLIYQSPSASYQVTDNLSAGISVGLGQTSASGKTLARSPSDMTALTREVGEATEGFAIPPFSYLWWDEPWYGGGIHPWEAGAKVEFMMRDDFTPSYNLGILYDPLKWLGLGVVYQSAIESNLHGTFKMSYSEEFQKLVHWNGQGPWGTRRTSQMLDLPMNPTPYQRGTITQDVTFPQRIQAGVRVSPTSRMHLTFDLKWAEWSVVKEHKMVFDQTIQALQAAKLQGHKYGNRTIVTERNFKDTIDYSIGMEYNLSDRVDVRLGYDYRESSIPKEYMDLATPLPDLHMFATGATLHFENGGRLDIALAYTHGRTINIGPEESKNLTHTDYFFEGTQMFAGQHFKQDFNIWWFSVGFVVPFRSYVEYQGGNREKIAGRIRLLNPFKRTDPVEETP